MILPQYESDKGSWKKVYDDVLGITSIDAVTKYAREHAYKLLEYYLEECIQGRICGENVGHDKQLLFVFHTFQNFLKSKSLRGFEQYDLQKLQDKVCLLPTLEPQCLSAVCHLNPDAKFTFNSIFSLTNNKSNN